MEILGRMVLAEVGFCGAIVWSGECILGRSGENKVGGSDGAEVDLGGAEVVSHAVRVDSLD